MHGVLLQEGRILGDSAAADGDCTEMCLCGSLPQNAQSRQAPRITQELMPPKPKALLMT